jgi:hypothetical protein
LAAGEKSFAANWLREYVRVRSRARFVRAAVRFVFAPLDGRNHSERTRGGD